jgi:hypothetical protein
MNIAGPRAVNILSDRSALADTITRETQNRLAGRSEPSANSGARRDK